MNVRALARGMTAAIITGVIAWALVAPAGAHISKNVDHLWREHIKPKIADPGTINDADNPVHWTKLKGVPSALADGKDAGVEIAGFGLLLVDDQFGRRFAVNQDQIQRRVDGCSGDASISAINEDGSVVCNPDDISQGGTGGQSGFSVYDGDTGIICNTEFCQEGKLSGLPSGYWVVFGNITATCQILSHCEDESFLTWCRLVAGGKVIARSDHVLVPSTDGVLDAALSLHGAGQFSGDVELTCRDWGDAGVYADYEGQYMTLTAIPLAGLTIQQP